MSKAVLISIRPEWCKKILDGEKTVEVRRTCPVHGTPFKAYIYCTLAGSDSLFMDVINRDMAVWNRGGWPEKKGSVIGEFTCKKITGLTNVGETGNGEPANLCVMEPGLYYKPADELLKAACLSVEAAEKYLKGRDGFGWHISDLKIYDCPRPLSDFSRLRANKFGYEPVKIKKPPQSWYYVEGA